jgi:acetyl-CoA acetyltransferase
MDRDDLYAQAGLTPADVDLFQPYDDYPVITMMQLEDLGFCEKGEGPAFVRANTFTIDGSLPLNTSGGNLAECYMHGLELVIEAVRQIRGTAINQLPKVDTSIVIGGPMVTPVSSLILGSEAAL